MEECNFCEETITKDNDGNECKVCLKGSLKKIYGGKDWEIHEQILVYLNHAIETKESIIDETEEFEQDSDRMFHIGQREAYTKAFYFVCDTLEERGIKIDNQIFNKKEDE